MEGVGGRLRFTEDNPGSYASCAEFKRITGQPPTAAMGYHETGAKTGGTLLTDAEINAQAAACGSPVIVLTRAFCHTDADLHCVGDPSVPAPTSPWVIETQRALANPNVFGVAMEYTPLGDPYAADRACQAAHGGGASWGTCNCQGCNGAGLMHAALAKNKSVLLLWPVYVRNQNETAWENVRDAVTQLRAHGAPMESDKVILVLARYDTAPPHGPVEWWGPGNTVQHAYEWLQAHRTASLGGSTGLIDSG